MKVFKIGFTLVLIVILMVISLNLQPCVSTKMYNSYILQTDNIIH